jgi:hypothetical protein
MERQSTNRNKHRGNELEDIQRESQENRENRTQQGEQKQKKKEQGAGRKLEDRSFAQRLPIRAKSLRNQVSKLLFPCFSF